MMRGGNAMTKAMPPLVRWKDDEYDNRLMGVYLNNTLLFNLEDQQQLYTNAGTRN